MTSGEWQTDVPHAPYCADEEVQQLRDLWRPDVQANYMPLSTLVDGQRVSRPDDYDSTQTSMWSHYPMYVIPPAVAGPVLEELKGQADGPLFESFGNPEYALMHGALRFAQRFVASGIQRSKLPRERYMYVSANFDVRGNASQTTTFEDRVPSIGADVQIVERGINYTEKLVRRLEAGLDDHYGGLAFFDDGHMEPEPREGILGWTVPRHDKEYQWLSSLLLAKNHLVELHWYMGPPERLGFYFTLPQLSMAGVEALPNIVAAHELALPQGTDYDEVYDYHPRLKEGDIGTYKKGWVNTTEDRHRTEKEARDYARTRW